MAFLSIEKCCAQTVSQHPDKCSSTDIFIDLLPNEQCSIPLDATISLALALALALANDINTRKNNDNKTFIF